MSLKLISEEWELILEDDTMTDYDNYADGFSPLIVEGSPFDTVRVFITVDKKTGSKVISAYPWIEGETYTAHEHIVPNFLQVEIENLIKATKFYQGLIS